MAPEPIAILAFDDIVADEAKLEIRRAGEVLELEPKALRVLFYLMRHRDRVVTKEELMAEVWGGTFVTDNALTRVVAQIRKQLGDNARAPRYIETAASTGYRFIAEIRMEDVPTASVPMAKRSSLRPALVIAAALTLVAALLWMVTFSGSKPVRLERLRQITRAAAAADLWPTFSPDGGQIAFSSDRSGVFEIYILSLASGSTERQLTKDGEENVQPAWSPDGQNLAYVARKQGGIAVVPVSGGVTRHVTDHGDSPAWSPDGKFLAFRVSSLEINPAIETTGVPETNIWIVAADGSGARALTKPHSPEGGHNFPRWSPDGRNIIFSTKSRTPWAVNVQTGKLEEIRIAAGVVRSPALSSDGAHLYYVGEGLREPGLWHAPIRHALSGGFQAGTPELLVPPGGPIPRDLALSPDGKHVAFSQQTGESAIWFVPLAADGKASGEPRALIQDHSVRNTEPVFSSDGTHIAFSSLRQGGETAVLVANADGSNPHPVTAPDDGSSTPSWRGRGGTLGVRSIQKRERSYWLLTPGAKPERLQVKLDLDRADRMRFSPDGKQMAAHINTSSGMQIVVEDLSTHVIRKLTPDNQDYGFPHWSNDGRWIASNRIVAGKNQIAYMPAAGGEIRQVNTGKTQSMGFDWSPDSSKISFAGLENGVWNVYWVELSTGKVEQLTHFTSHSAFVRYPSWSPKGDQIIFENNNVSANIYVADMR